MCPRCEGQVQYIVYEGEGHGFDKPENATAFLDRVDELLRTNNPVD